MSEEQVKRKEDASQEGNDKLHGFNWDKEKQKYGITDSIRETTIYKLNSELEEEPKKKSRPNNLIRLNVGGKIFTTSKQTLLSMYSVFTPMLNDTFDSEKDEDGNIFMDRSPKHFKVILELFRNGKLLLPKDVDVDAVNLELKFYGLNYKVGPNRSIIQNPNDDFPNVEFNPKLDGVYEIYSYNESNKIYRWKFVPTTHNGSIYSPEFRLHDWRFKLRVDMKNSNQLSLESLSSVHLDYRYNLYDENFKSLEGEHIEFGKCYYFNVRIYWKGLIDTEEKDPKKFRDLKDYSIFTQVIERYRNKH